MILELSLGVIAGIILLAFICEYMDSTLGMGYGTTLTPILLIAGYSPLRIIPVILISELITGLLAAFFHHKEGNVDFKPKLPKITGTYRKFQKRKFPQHLKVALVLATCSILGTIVAVFIAVNIPKFWLKLYIGCLVFSMGIIILICRNKEFHFSWKKISFLGLIASFNKGMSGGGYGPVVTGGQILSGVEEKSAIGITSLAEGLTCAVGIISYMLILNTPLDLKLAPFILVGAALSVPFSAKSVKKITAKKLKMAIAALSIILGLLTIIKTIQF